METIFGFPKADRNETSNFKHNALQSVIFYIGIDENPNVINHKSEIAELLGEKFNVIDDIMQASFSVGEDNHITSNNVGFSFKEESTQTEFQIQNTHIRLSLQGKEYHNFNELKNTYQGVFRRILNILGISSMNRVSIRKINLVNLSLPSTDIISVEFLEKALNLELIKSFQVFPQKSLVSNCTSTVTFSKDNYFLRLVYGMLKQNASNYNVLIDMDAIIQQQIDSEALFEHWETPNNEIYNTFMWSIGEELKQFLTQD